MEVETMAQSEVWSLVGRIVHYCPLVPGGAVLYRPPDPDQFDVYIKDSQG